MDKDEMNEAIKRAEDAVHLNGARAYYIPEDINLLIAAAKALTTLDRIIADHSPDASKMVVPDGYKLVPIEVVKEIGKLSTILSIEEYKERENYCVDEEDMANTFMDAYDMFVRDVRLLNKKMLSSAPTPAQPEKVIDWAGLDKIRKSATGKTLDQLNAWSYANDTRKAGDNAYPEKVGVYTTRDKESNIMEMPDFLFIQLGRDRGRTFIRKFDTKSPFDGATGYVNYDEYRRVYDDLKQENDENCRLLGMSAEREIQLLQKVQQLENQVSCLMQNSESQTQTQIALIKKLEKAKWRPIETAPKDGTRIITCCMSPSEYTTVKAGFMVINGYDDRILSWPLHNKVHFPATHWMPLPEPPTTEEKK